MSEASSIGRFIAGLLAGGIEEDHQLQELIFEVLPWIPSDRPYTAEMELAGDLYGFDPGKLQMELTMYVFEDD